MSVRSFLAQPFEETEALAERFRASAAGRRFDARAAGICLIAAASLCGISYLGAPDTAAATLDSLGCRQAANALRDWLSSLSDSRLAVPSWWAVVAIVFYCMTPSIVIRALWRESLARFGLQWGKSGQNLREALVIGAVILPMDLLISATPAFQLVYPLYRAPPALDLLPHFIVWEILYLMQVFALEFFFRGFLLHGLKFRFGYYAVFVSNIPYCMIHFARPAPEALGSIFAGVALGHLSLKSESILPGALVHGCIALAMDASVLLQRGLQG